MADEPKKPARTRAAAKPAAEGAGESKKPAARARAASTKGDAAAKPAARTRAAAKTTDEAAAKKPAGESKAAAASAEKPARAIKAAAASAEKPARRRAAVKRETGDAPVEAPRSRAAAKTPAKAAAETPTPAVEAPKRAPSRARSAKTPATPAPAPARRRRAVPTGPVTVTARARYVRGSARKARLVCDHIRGKPVPEARALLAFAPRGVARDWEKLLNSAIANAENNHELVADELRVTAVYADEGPTIKRFKPRAMGRATPILKRTSHLTIELGTEG